MSIGARLKEERERLGLSQDAFAQIGGIQRRAQVRYEQDERQPDAVYLAAVAANGVDVLYLLTGQRSGTPPLSPLKPEEEALLDNYRNSPEDQKRLLRETSAAFAQRIKGKRSA